MQYYAAQASPNSLFTQLLDWMKHIIFLGCSSFRRFTRLIYLITFFSLLLVHNYHLTSTVPVLLPFFFSRNTYIIWFYTMREVMFIHFCQWPSVVCTILFFFNDILGNDQRASGPSEHVTYAVKLRKWSLAWGCTYYRFSVTIYICPSFSFNKNNVSFSSLNIWLLKSSLSPSHNALCALKPPHHAALPPLPRSAPLKVTEF